MKRIGCRLVAVLLGVSACGYGSVNSIFSEADTQYDSRLIGTWQDAEGKESATITADSSNGYVLVYRDEEGKTGVFQARLGHVGTLRALDLEPTPSADEFSDVYQSLLLPLHAALILDSVGDSVQFRMLEPDSIKQVLDRRPGDTPHLLRGDAIVLTGTTAEVQRFLAGMVRRPGVLGEPTVWRRRLP